MLSLRVAALTDVELAERIGEWRVYRAQLLKTIDAGKRAEDELDAAQAELGVLLQEQIRRHRVKDKAEGGR